MPSSNDLLADRRFAWAAALTAEGDHAAAADLLAQVVERVPAWAPGWAALADARERTDAPDEALAAWTRVAALDRDGTLGAALHCARLRAETPKTMPAAYVRAVFDDYAPRFDRHLVDTLHYRAPEVLAQALDRVAPGRRFRRTLDLGCGTGLMGRALEGRCAEIDGIDLSPAMVEIARRAGIYASLDVVSLDDALSDSTEGGYDLVTAADVLVYVGDLSPAFAGVHRALERGGLFAFTLQAIEDPAQGAPPFVLGPQMRFSHTPDYARAMLADTGLGLRSLERGSTRTETGRPVPGLIAIAAHA